MFTIIDYCDVVEQQSTAVADGNVTSLPQNVSLMVAQDVKSEIMNQWDYSSEDHACLYKI